MFLNPFPYFCNLLLEVSIGERSVSSGGEEVIVRQSGFLEL
jgi:hypothetical protein